MISISYELHVFSEHELTVWDVKTGDRLWNIRHFHYTIGVTTSPSEEYTVVGTYDKTPTRLRAFDSKTGHLLNQTSVSISRTSGASGVNSLCFNSSGTMIAATCSDKKLRLLKTEDVTQSEEDNAHSVATYPCYGDYAEFSGDDTRILTLQIGLPPTVLNAKTGEQLVQLRNSGTVFLTRFSKDGSRIVTGSTDKTVSTVRIWDATSGALLHTLLGCSSPFMDVNFCGEDGKWVMAFETHRIMFWDAQTGDDMGSLFEFPSDLKVATVSRRYLHLM